METKKPEGSEIRCGRCGRTIENKSEKYLFENGWRFWKWGYQWVCHHCGEDIFDEN